MERKIGEIFSHGKIILQVVEESKGGCRSCFFDLSTGCGDENFNVLGLCSKYGRQDKKSVIAKKINLTDAKCPKCNGEISTCNEGIFCEKNCGFEIII